MKYIEPHAHMVSRITDDYMKITMAGCQAVCEPAFWAGFDRSSAQGFHDYFCQLTEHEPRRAAKFGLPHFSWLCINPKESEDEKLAQRNESAGDARGPGRPARPAHPRAHPALGGQVERHAPYPGRAQERPP